MSNRVGEFSMVYDGRTYYFNKSLTRCFCMTACTFSVYERRTEKEVHKKIGIVRTLEDAKAWIDGKEVVVFPIV